ncbi:MAG TPA: ABC transporter permease [Gemmatimonadales bacterium]|jgi:ABC-2 type transport system permease protein
MSWQRISAIIERELRKFLRTPMVLVMTLIMPLMQLFVLGNAFGGRVTNLKLAVVDEDGGPAARRLRAAVYVLEANGGVVHTLNYPDEQAAAEAVRRGQVQGALIIPAHFSRDVYSGGNPDVGLLLDNTDNFVSSSLRGLAAGAVQEAARDHPAPRMSAAVTLEPVELYSYIPYMRYMLPGVISLGLFMSVMVGGAIMYLDDKQRGVHEGYLVTPITKFEIVLAQNLAGTLKATLGGVLLIVVGGLAAGATGILQPLRLMALILLVAITSFAFMAMTSCLVARVNNPILPRAIFGMLNTLLYFPSGAIYPTQALPPWLRVVSRFDPFTYAVHALRFLLLKGADVTVIFPDLAFLSLFAAMMFTGAVLLFKRTL